MDGDHWQDKQERTTPCLKFPIRGMTAEGLINCMPSSLSTSGRNCQTNACFSTDESSTKLVGFVALPCNCKVALCRRWMSEARDPRKDFVLRGPCQLSTTLLKTLASTSSVHILQNGWLCNQNSRLHMGKEKCPPHWQCEIGASGDQMERRHSQSWRWIYSFLGSSIALYCSQGQQILCSHLANSAISTITISLCALERGAFLLTSRWAELRLWLLPPIVGGKDWFKALACILWPKNSHLLSWMRVYSHSPIICRGVVSLK